MEGFQNLALLSFIAFAAHLSFNSLVFAEVKPHQDNFHKHEHFGANQEHDVRYDHEAFLGPEADLFEHLTPEESKRRLKTIVIKLIDTNRDGLVSPDELSVWIEKQRKAFMYEDVDKRIKKEDKDGDGEISWDEYSKSEYGEWHNPEKLPRDHVSFRETWNCFFLWNYLSTCFHRTAQNLFSTFHLLRSCKNTPKWRNMYMWINAQSTTVASLTLIL